jgi:hypothetical protein
MLTIVDKTRVGYTELIDRIEWLSRPDGDIVPRVITSVYAVYADRYNRAWPGMSTDLLFSVNRYETKEGGFFCTHSWGFVTEQEAFDFLSGHGMQEYRSFDQQGNPIVDYRVRLGIPDAKIHRL